MIHIIDKSNFQLIVIHLNPIETKKLKYTYLNRIKEDIRKKLAHFLG